MSSWHQVQIGEVAEILDGPHATPKTVDAGPIFLGIAALQQGRINLGETRHVTAEDFKTWTRRVRPQPGDVVFSYETRIGEAAIIPEGLECCLGRRMGLVRADRGRLDPRFFLYTYLSPSYQEFLRSRTITGATVDRIALTEFPGFPILLPPISEQRAIASILGAIDDKIDLNRQMNETLEAMARAIFKDWFVDFGPVRAKAEGCQPHGLAPDIAALFPNALDGEDKPVEWQAVSLGHVCQLKRGYDLPTAQRESGPYPIVSSSGISGAHSSFMAQAPGVVTGRYGTIGEVFFVEENFWPLNTALYVHDYKNNEPRYVYYLLRGVDFTRYSDKGAVPGINRNHLHDHPVVCAPLPVQHAFVETLRSFWEKQQANRAESDTLAALRNLLLPKLMSGEIRIQDAEALVSEAA